MYKDIELGKKVEGVAYIYKISNKENGKIYIGSTINARARESQHFSDLKKERIAITIYKKHGISMEMVISSLK